MNLNLLDPKLIIPAVVVLLLIAVASCAVCPKTQEDLGRAARTFWTGVPVCCPATTWLRT